MNISSYIHNMLEHSKLNFIIQKANTNISSRYIQLYTENGDSSTRTTYEHDDRNIGQQHNNGYVDDIEVPISPVRKPTSSLPQPQPIGRPTERPTKGPTESPINHSSFRRSLKRIDPSTYYEGVMDPRKVKKPEDLTEDEMNFIAERARLITNASTTK